MIKLIAETAWHHEGDYQFMVNLISRICTDTKSDIVKMHITLDLDEYMDKDHEAYETLKSWLFTAEQWRKLIEEVQRSGKQLMLLLNDTSAIKFASQFNPDFVEIHSVCMNVPRLQNMILNKINDKAKIVIGVGGCTLDEIDSAVNVFDQRDVILMFGFQNYPTKYEDINLSKIRKIQSLYSGGIFGYADHTGWDEGNNELISTFVAANHMSYVEKHVTTTFGAKRCDYSAAISIDMFNQLADKLTVLNEISGDGRLELNSGEIDYSIYGPMKMAAIANHIKNVGDIFEINDFDFRRTSQSTKMSQLDVLSAVGSTIKKSITVNQVIDWECFE